MHNIRQLFDKNNILAKFQNIDLSKLCPYIERQVFQKGELIFSFKKRAEHYYVIDSGSIILENNEQKQIVLNDFDSFGDESTFGSGIYLSNAYAQTDTTVLAIQSEVLMQSQSFKHCANLFRDNFFQNTEYQNPLVYSNQLSDQSKDQQKQKYRLRIFGWLASLVLPLLISYSLLFLEYPPNQNQLLFIFIFLSAVVMWSLQLVPEFVPSIYLLLGMVLLSLAPTSVTLSGFSSDTFFLALALSIMGVIISSSGLSYRLLLYMLRLGRQKGKFWYHFSIFISGLILTPVIPSANGRVSMIYSLFNEIVTLFKIKPGSKEFQRLIAATIGGASLLSPIFLTSKSINLIALGMLSPQEQYNFQFFYWLVAASIVAIVLLLFYFLAVWLLFRNTEEHPIDNKILSTQIQVLGKLTIEEIFASITIITFVIIVSTTDYHNLRISWLAMLLTFFLFVLGVLKRNDFKHAIDWDFLIFLAAILSFSNTMNYLDVHTWIGHYTEWIENIFNLGFIPFSLILSTVVILLRLILPINIAVILAASVLIPISANTAVNPWLTVFIILLMAETYTYNFSASYVVQFFSLIDYHQTHWRLLSLQLFVYIVKFLGIIVSVPFWQYLGLLE